MNLSIFSWLSGGSARPVFGDLGEQSVLHGILLGSARRVVSDDNGDAEFMADLDLDFDLPGLGGATVAARQNRPEAAGMGP
jgi:hypothetical protein